VPDSPEKFALIIGAMKSGTTSLFSYLNTHPEICGSRKKEPFAFARDDYPKNIDVYSRSWDWDAEHHKIALEASTDYTKYPAVKNVPKRVAGLGKNRYKLIYIIRHPLRRIESHVRYTILTKCEICGAEKEGVDFSLAAGVTDNHIAFSSYAMQLDKWMKYFNRDDLFIVTLEELQSNTIVVLNNIIKYLKLDSSIKFNNLDKVYAKTPNVKHEYEVHPFWTKLRSVKCIEKIYTKLLSSKQRQYLVGYISNDINRYLLNENEKKYALHRLMPDIKRLNNEYQVDTATWWGIS